MKIKIKVKPNSGRQEIVEKEKEKNDLDKNKEKYKEYVVYLKSIPENNKANLELIKLLKRYFKKEVKIVSGFNSRNKMVDIE